jgi:hypothetical protein
MPEYGNTTFDNDSTLDGVDIFDVLGLYPRPQPHTSRLQAGLPDRDRTPPPRHHWTPLTWLAAAHVRAASADADVIKQRFMRPGEFEHAAWDQAPACRSRLPLR